MMIKKKKTSINKQTTTRCECGNWVNVEFVWIWTVCVACVNAVAWCVYVQCGCMYEQRERGGCLTNEIQKKRETMRSVNCRAIFLFFMK